MVRKMARKRADALDSPAAKVLAVLAAVARLKAVPVSILAQKLGLPLPTVHRICAALERRICRPLWRRYPPMRL